MPKTQIHCKVCSLAATGKFMGIMEMTDRLLDSGYGVRKIQKALIKKYNGIQISPGSIWKHKKHRSLGKSPNKTDKQEPYTIYVASASSY